MRVVRSILALLAGCLAAGVLTAVCESLGHLAFPPPPGTDMSSHEAIARNMDKIPRAAMAAVVLGWAIGTCAGAAVAAWLAPRAPRAHGLVVGLVMLGLGLFTMIVIPHPLWFWVAALVLTPLAAWLGLTLGAAKNRPPVAN